MRRLFRLSGREPGPEQDVETELESHLAMKVEALVRAGWSPAAAIDEARRQFGSVSEVGRLTRAEAGRMARRRRWHDVGGAWWLDVRLAVRSLRRAPGYTVTAAGILALGIGASLAVAAVALQLFLSPLPIANPDRVVVLFEASRDGGLRLPSYPTVQDWRRQSDAFATIGYVPGDQILWHNPAGAESILAAFPSDEFFPAAGVTPLLGRTLTAADGAGQARVGVLSYQFWRRRFSGDRSVVGTTLSVADGPISIVGVMPPSFRIPSWADLYLPLQTMSHSGQQMIALRGNHADGLIVGRLKPGVSLEQATASLGVVANRLAREFPVEQGDWTGVSLISIRDYLYHPDQFSGRGLPNPTRTILLFAGAVALVLLIACANVAGLTLVRAQARAGELAIQAALGAARWQLVRQRLVESGLVAALGGVLGVGLAGAILAVARRAGPDLFPRLIEARIDLRLVTVTVGLALVAAILSGLAPALRSDPGQLASLVKDGARGTASRSRVGTQRLLVGFQLGLAVTLLAGSALLVESFVKVLAAPVGFDPNGLVAVAINPDRAKYSTAAATTALYRHLLDEVRRVPGVESVAIANHLPIAGSSLETRVEVAGATIPKGTSQPTAQFRVVSPSYFDTMRIPVRRGRVFAEVDLAGPNDALVINETLARRSWPGQDPIGRRITVFKSARWLPDFGQPITGQVIGVVGDVRHFGPEATATSEVYLPYTWNPWAWTGLAARVHGSAAAMTDPIWRAVAAVDPDLPIISGTTPNVSSFGERLAEMRGPRRMMTAVAVGVAATALILAVVGLYGLMAYLVGQRRREIAIRGALGATRGELIALVMRPGLRLTAIGTVAGLVGAWLAAATLESLVFEVSARDLKTFALVPILLFAVAALAIYLPARRASRTDPALILRGD